MQEPNKITMKEIFLESLIKHLKSRGFDVFIKNDYILTFNDGFLVSSLIDNLLKLYNDIRMPLSIYDISDLLISKHITEKEICKEGKFNSMKSRTDVEVKNMILMEILKETCIELTPEIYNKITSKIYANGKDMKIGDLLLYVMLIEDNSLKNKVYHMLPINYNDLNFDYKFIEFFNPEDKEFKFPIVEGKFNALHTDSKDSDTEFEKRAWNYYFDEGDLVYFADDIPLNYDIINLHENSHKKINLNDFENKTGVVKRCWPDLESFGRGSCYLCEVDFNGETVTNFAQFFTKKNVPNFNYANRNIENMTYSDKLRILNENIEFSLNKSMFLTKLTDINLNEIFELLKNENILITDLPVFKFKNKTMCFAKGEINDDYEHGKYEILTVSEIKKYLEKKYLIFIHTFFDMKYEIEDVLKYRAVILKE